jgi:hypothetical protein
MKSKVEALHINSSSLNPRLGSWTQWIINDTIFI